MSLGKVLTVTSKSASRSVRTGCGSACELTDSMRVGASPALVPLSAEERVAPGGRYDIRAGSGPLSENWTDPFTTTFPPAAGEAVFGTRLRIRRAAERTALVAAVGAAALLRAMATLHYRIDSDEPQHLHVAWAWSRGLLQYRDVFDNHMPLFHLAMAPLLRLFGERAVSLIWMRAAMVPLYAATILLTYRIAASCYAKRTARWIALVASLVPGYLLCSTEFRTDDLWTVFWLLSIAILVTGRPGRPMPRTFAAGVALGFAFITSAKTTLLILALLAGAGAVLVVRHVQKGFVARHAAAFLAGLVLPPAAAAAWLAARGAFGAFVYGTVLHNVARPLHVDRVLAFPCLLTLIIVFGRHVYSNAATAEEGARRLFLFVTANIYAATMFCLWPLVEREHWLPYYPLAVVTIVPYITRGSLRRLLAIAVMEAALVTILGGLWHDRTAWGLRVVDETLQLTTPDETVIDLKGETAFRRRAFFYTLEPMTQTRIHRGLIDDTIVRDVLRTHTMLAPRNIRGFPRTARAFLERNFVPVGAVRVAGKILSRGQATFRIQVPAMYAVVAERGSFAGRIDGRRYDQPRFLAAGMHSIAAAADDAMIAVVWSRAVERGFSPFPRRPAHRHRHGWSRRIGESPMTH